jgi:ceramide glucosyltransferase
MALSRRALEAIGGFAAFVDVLAEDQAIGCAVRDAGLKVALSPVVVRNVSTHRPLERALARQVRWGKIRFAFSKLTYTGELLLNPFPVALLACAAAALLAPRVLTPAALLAGALFFLRLLQGFALAQATHADHSALQLLLLPVKDVLQLFTQVTPYFSKEVDWQGHRARLGPGTLLLPSRHATATAAAA